MSDLDLIKRQVTRLGDSVRRATPIMQDALTPRAALAHQDRARLAWIDIVRQTVDLRRQLGIMGDRE